MVKAGDGRWWWLIQPPGQVPPCSLWALGIIILSQHSLQDEDFPGGRRAFFCPRYRIRKETNWRRKFPVEKDRHWDLKSPGVGFRLEKGDGWTQDGALMHHCDRPGRWKLRAFISVFISLGFIFFAPSFEVKGKTIHLTSQYRENI